MRNTHSRRVRTRARFLPLLSLFALIVMLVGPLAGTGALAGEDPPAEEATEEPVEAQPTEVPPTEEPVEAVATEEPTEIPAVAGPSRLTITVYMCNHPTFDTGFSENIQMVLDTCRDPGYGTFTIETGIATSPQSGQSVQFEIAGSLAIIESIPSGYDNPIADCYIYRADGSLADRIGPSETSGGGWKLGSIADGDVHCDWYQVDRGLGNVYIVNMACPSTAGLFPEPSMDELVQMCTEPAGQGHFLVEHGPGLERQGVSGGEFNDTLVEAVSTGPIAIRLSDPVGFDSARVFCQVFGTDQITQVAPFSEVAVSNFRASGLTLLNQHRIHCSWFNIQEGPGFEQSDGGDDPVDPIEPTETPGQATSEFTVVKHTCPEDYDPEDDDANPMTDCPEGPNGITFTLSNDDTELVDTTGSSAANRATFANLAPGDYDVTETVPDEVDDIFVLGCGGGGGVDPIPQFIDGTLTVGIPQGVISTCHWFNIADDDSQIARDLESTPMTIAALEGTSSLTIQKYQCPAGFDVTTVDANPSAACTTPGVGISFDIDDEIDDNAGYSIETGVDGTSTISDLPAGTYTIDEGVRNGTTSVFVWDCYDANGTSTRTDPLAMSSTIQIEIEDGANIRCDWYNVVGGTSRVVIAKHGCDYLVPAYTLSLEELRTQCTIDTGMIDFTVVSDTHQETQPASNNPLTLASFANVPSGYVAVVEDLPGGWAIPIVSCQLFDENGLPIGEPSFMDVLVGRQVSFNVEPGQVMSCDWYNVAQGFVDIHVTKYACPDGLDPYRATLTDLVVGCTDDPGSVEFYVEDGSLYLEERTATAAAPASWTDVPSGDLRINEKQQAGYGVPVVWCRIDFEDGSNVRLAQPVSVTNGSNAGYLSIYHDASAGQVLYCEWFNVKGGTGMVSVWKEACPEGFDAHNATRQQLENACDESIPDIQFTVISGGFAGYATSTNLFRYADFYAVPAGPLTVSEQVQTGYGTPVVWCRVQSDAGGVTDEVKVEVSNGNTISWDLKAGEWLICEWYNAHDTENTIVIHKYDCPEGTDPEHEREWFTTECTTPHNEVEFIVTSGNGVSIGYTANGMVEFPGIPLGNTLIQESIPEGYGDPVVFCGFAPVSETVTEINPARAEGGAVNMAFDEANYRFECWWFNLKDGPGEIWIEKYTCPDGYDVRAHDADPVKDCPEATNGVRFSLGNASAEFTATTGDEQDGVAVFREVEYGQWTIAEEIPDDTHEVFVLDCTGQREGELRPTPLSFGGSLEIDLAAGEKVTCRWYNVPEDDPDYGRMTVIKYACTTEEFESDIDCEIEEGGVTIDLDWWNGDDWETASSRETDGAGRATWTELEPGQYWLDEQDGSFCYLASDSLSDEGNWLDVDSGEETVVHVYNCSSEPGGQPGKVPQTPTKYPNTGVPPAITPDQTTP